MPRRSGEAGPVRAFDARCSVAGVGYPFAPTNQGFRDIVKPLGYGANQAGNIVMMAIVAMRLVGCRAGIRLNSVISSRVCCRAWVLISMVSKVLRCSAFLVVRAILSRYRPRGLKRYEHQQENGKQFTHGGDCSS